MKILQLDLIAFGLFTNKILDFSAKQPSLHLIYGANEAGKSSLRRALTHLLFGIPERTLDAHLHSTTKLRIGAHLINAEGEKLLCYRRKGRKNTLLDIHNNNPLNEECLDPFLGGMKEAQFTALCCFDHKRLRQGGEDLLQGGGDVGESLFEAGTGSLKIHDVLAELDKEKECLFKTRASKPLLNKAISDYQNAKQDIFDHSLSAHKWTEQATHLAQTQEKLTKLTQHLQNCRTVQHRLHRIQRTRPQLRRYQELKTELLTLESVIILPDDAILKHNQAKLTWRTAQTQEAQAQEVILELENELKRITISQDFLIQKATIDDLRGRLGSHQKAARDLPGVRTEMRTVESDARALLLRIYPKLDLQDVQKYLVTNAQRDHIKHLADRYPALYEKYNSIQTRLEEVAQLLVQQTKALDHLPISPDLTSLQMLLTRICKYGELEENHAKKESELRLLTNKAKIQLKHIGCWSSLEALEQVVLPKMERISNFERRFSDSTQEQLRIKERLLEIRQRNEHATQKINTLSWMGDIPTEKDLHQARQMRQTYWQDIKKTKKGGASPKNTNLPLFDDKTKAYFSQFKKGETLNFDEKTPPPSADEKYTLFEKAMMETDELSDRLRHEASRIAEYGMLLAEQESTKIELEHHNKKWYQYKTLLSNLTQEWEQSWQSVGIKPWKPSEMRSWLNDSLYLREQMNELRHRRHLAEERQELITRLCQELMKALFPFVGTSSLTHLSDLIEQGNICVSKMKTQQHECDKLQLEINSLIKEQHGLKTVSLQTNQTLKQWQAKWIHAIIPLDLPSDTLPNAVRNVLNDLDQVLNKIDKAHSLEHRVTLMEKDAAVFQQDVATLVQQISPEFTQKSVEESVPALSKRLNQAEKEYARYEQLQQRLQVEQHRLSDAHQQVQLTEAHLQVLQEQAHCSDLITLEKAEKDSIYKKERLITLAKVEEQLLEQGEGLSLADLAEEVQKVDIDELPGSLQTCTETIQKLDKQRSDTEQNIGKLQTLLKQMDGNANAGQAADNAQLALAKVQEFTERYMHLHLASSVLKKSIERYRAHNQAPLVKRAST
ncbi:MAG: AAA family ATPase, partial [Thiomargarita sp.]|nr:AAA family ATPase [Thiomargarita sp.]